jgi:hypothetical protein
VATIDSSSNNPAFVAAINLSEAQRQSEEEIAYQNFGQPGTRTAQTATGTESAMFALAIKQANVRDLKRRIAICAVYSQNDSPWRSALRTLLGTDFG